jgi:glucose repression regulatory protein TUP1
VLPTTPSPFSADGKKKGRELQKEKKKQKREKAPEPMVLDAFVRLNGPNDDTKEPDASGGSPTPPHHPEPEHGQSNAITSIAISPYYRYVAAGCLNNNIYLWDLGQTSSSSRKRQPPVRVACIRGHENSVYSVSFSNDGRFLVSASLDKTVKVWDVAVHLAIPPQEPRSNSPHSAPGEASSSGPQPRCVKEFVGHEDYILSAAVSHDGRFIASAGRDRSVRFWDFGDLRTSRSSDDAPEEELTPPSMATEKKPLRVLSQVHENTIISVDFSPRGNMLATASGDRTVKICEWFFDTP